MKSIVLIALVVALIAAVGLLTFIIRDESNPLVLLISQASNDDPLGQDEFFVEDTPTPTISYTSTSPTPEPTTGLELTIPEETPTPEPTELPETGGDITATPTPITQLPTAGITDYMPAVIGGVFLVLIALIL